MMKRMTGGKLLVLLALGACELHVDETDDGYQSYDPGHPSYPPHPPYPPTSHPPPSGPADAVAPDASSTMTTARDDGEAVHTPAIAWATTSGGFVLQSVAAIGFFPSAFTVQLDGTRPPQAALRQVMDADYGFTIAVGHVVVVRGGRATAETVASDLGSPCGPAVARCPHEPEGVVEDYLVLYNEAELGEGTFLSGLFNDYRALYPGVHLIRTTALDATQLEQASVCRKQAASRALARYNLTHGTAFRDDTELRSALWWEQTFEDEAHASACLADYEALLRTMHSEQRCRFPVRREAVTHHDTCVLNAQLGAALPAVDPY